MTASPQPETGHEQVTKRDPMVGLTAKGRARLVEIKARNALVVAINGQSWGASLTQLQQRAFAEYMRRFRLDISEIDNLGGRPYRNGRYYMRRCAELVAAGRVDWYRGDHIGLHEDLTQLARDGDPWALEETVRRRRERIRHDVPPTATHAYVVTVKMKELSVPTEGCKFYVPGRQKLGWDKEVRGKRVMVSADPVGDENPTTSVETRAWRRCGRLAFAEIPELREEEELMERAADDTEAAVIEEAVRAEEVNEAATITTKPLPVVGDDPYGPATAPAPRALTEGAAQAIPVPARDERVASTVPDGPEADPRFEFIDDRDLVD